MEDVLTIARKGRAMQVAPQKKKKKKKSGGVMVLGMEGQSTTTPTTKERALRKEYTGAYTKKIIQNI